MAALAQIELGAAPAPREDALQETIVFGHPLVRRAEDLAQPLLVLTGADLDARLAGTLGETVGREPGIQNASFGVAVGRPVIRGQEGVRVRTLEDSLDALDVSAVSGDHAVAIEPFTANQIEILAGPATLLYGSGAIGGVVNVITGRVPESLPRQAIAGRVELRGGGAADERTASVRLDGAVSQLAWHVDGMRRESNDYEIVGNARAGRLLRTGAADASPRRDTLRNSDSEADGYAFGASWHMESGFIGASVSNFATNYGLPASDEGDVRIDLTQDRFDVVAAIDDPLPNIARLSARVGSNSYEHDEIEPTGEVATHFENDGLDIRLLAEHEPIAGIRGVIGLQVVDRDFVAVGEEAFVPPSDTRSHALFVTEAADFGNLRLQFGGRYERVQIESDATSDFEFAAYSFSAGVVMPFATNHSVALQLDRSMRAPVAEELLANGPHLATRTFEVGDAALDEEIATNVSASYSYNDERFELVASLYRTAFEDFIFLADTGEIEDDLPVRVHRQQDARFYGAEFSTTVHLHALMGQAEGATFDVALFGDYVRGQLDGGDDLPRIAPWRSGIALRVGWDQFAGELSYTRVGTQKDVAEFELPTDGYSLLDLALTWHLDFGRSHLELFARGNNLLDVEARNHLSVIKDAAPLPGRGVMGGVRMRF